MTFMSTGMQRRGGSLTLTGMLTVRQVAQPVTLVIEQCTPEPAGPHSLTILASTRIDRTRSA